MQPVGSSAIAAVGYEEDGGVLQVSFVAGGSYRCFDVAPQVAAAFIASEWKGRFFRAQILDRYAFEGLR